MKSTKRMAVKNKAAKSKATKATQNGCCDAGKSRMIDVRNVEAYIEQVHAAALQKKHDEGLRAGVALGYDKALGEIKNWVACVENLNQGAFHANCAVPHLYRRKHSGFTWQGLGIPVGGKLQFALDDCIEPVTCGTSKVIYNGKVYSLSHLTNMLGRASCGNGRFYRIGQHWSYNGRLLEYYINESYG